ncbi:IDEAL domain-containing protein [Mesobacillus foraminis]|uniref:IDEAL domain-containing protein n=1 Tax=Mesobacillus foraminis TaxID=279826 RepID=A0A4R2B9R2_9BACI|nr:IDEAL domain-containing protein [Mesobacillus foraminis]MBT2758177.1 IDEAL domain-containing protein [Mesobacillus foraminis]TCN22319.1 IDEAL domain-containing protein [Mesobacillus foraminis]
MKKNLLNSPHTQGTAMDSLLAEMVLEKALLNFRKEKIHQKIDQALKDNNKQEFLLLTEELKSIS